MRIGVNVPNELLRQVKQIRPEVNISQVCREALQHRVEVTQRAIAQAASDGVDEHVTRLDQSVARSLIEPDWVAYALDDARDWVRAVTPEKWEQYIYQSDFLRRKGRDEAEMVEIWSGSGGEKGLLVRLYENMKWLEDQLEAQFESGDVADPHYKAREEYCRAWLDYVNEVRRLLEKHHKDEYDRVMAERAEHRRSRPSADLPPQLV